VTEWVAQAVVLAIHDEQIAEHGGSSGVRDLGPLQSVLDRPRNLEAYGNPDIADLAAAYAFGIARNRPFVDGNKRTAAVVTRTFLRLNGFDLNASQTERLETWSALGAGTLSEEALASWLQDRIVRI
jgi:death-on-curing protein